MINPNVGKKIPLPPRAGKAPPEAPPQPPPSAAASRVISSIEHRVKNLDFRAPAQRPDPAQASRPSRRAQDSEVPFKMKKTKAYWMEPAVILALDNLKKRGESISQFVNNAVKQALGL